VEDDIKRIYFFNCPERTSTHIYLYISFLLARWKISTNVSRWITSGFHLYSFYSYL